MIYGSKSNYSWEAFSRSLCASSRIKVRVQWENRKGRPWVEEQTPQRNSTGDEQKSPVIGELIAAATPRKQQRRENTGKRTGRERTRDYHPCWGDVDNCPCRGEGVVEQSVDRQTVVASARIVDHWPRSRGMGGCKTNWGLGA